ncbi:phosphatase PAP2-related protein [Prosthecobacter sp.]|uniref:phosphatase PAP2-related protein n=1 Tax=Prosthecobacter sp. TaxID=1965333 RepID=UPI001D90F7DD|nr:phosphatase PAP2-related protein [Prosthecobacter sp.]MCB1277705.1 phosphatase PAP2 family protein [Prosthecobacter sp.]
MNLTPILIRAGVVILALVAWHWTQALIARKSTPRHGLGDLIHDLTTHWHGWLSQNDRAANRLLIVSSFFIDALALSVIALAVFGGSFAPFIALLILFGMRQLSQAICTLPPPPGMIWRHPGCPSLLVTYEVGNDFFFSGHTAMAVLGALEIAHVGPLWLGIVVAVIAVGEMTTVLVLRAHYTLDVIAGAAVAFFAYQVAGNISPAVDAWLH